MLIAHVPSGYLLAKLIIRESPYLDVSPRAIMAVSVLGAVFPSIDMLVFYLIGQPDSHHHEYLTHWPVSWVALLVLAGVLSRWRRARNAATLLGIFALAGFMHLVLDTLVCDVWWLAPWVDQSFRLVTVTAVHTPWWLNYILHWTFAVELFICLIAGWVFFKSLRLGQR